MTDYDLPYFGQLDLNDLDGQYDADIQVNGQNVPTSLIFDETEIDAGKMDDIRHFIGNLHKWDNQNKGYIRKDYDDENGDTVKYYFQYHFEYLGKEHLSRSLNLESAALDDHEQLLNKLQLVRVALYPHSEDGYIAMFDYSFGREVTSHVIVISTDKDGNLHHIGMES